MACIPRTALDIPQAKLGNIVYKPHAAPLNAYTVGIQHTIALLPGVHPQHPASWPYIMYSCPLLELKRREGGGGGGYNQR